jgi:PhnB protein
MTIRVTPHLNFDGDARDALAFYQSVFGGDQTVVSYGDAGAAPDSAMADRVMWGQVAAANGFRIMAYDVAPDVPWAPGQNPFFVSVGGETAQEIEARWAGLIAGGAILVPLAPSAWSPLYGMVRDRFGVTWVLNVAAPGSF